MKAQNRKEKKLKPGQRLLRWRERLAGRKLGNIVADIRELRDSK